MGQKKRRIKKHLNAAVQNKPFWISLAAVCFLSLVVILLSFVNNSNVTGNAAVQTISYMQGGSELFFEIRNVNGLKDATIFIKEDLKDSLIFFEELEGTPRSFPGEVYSWFTVSCDDEDKIEKVAFTFKVERSKLQEKGIPYQELFLYQNNEELFTKITREEENYVYYQATSENLGEFVLGQMEEIVEIPPEEISAEEGEVVQEEEMISETEVVEEEALVGRAAEEPKGEGFFGAIKNFFKNLFK